MVDGKGDFLLSDHDHRADEMPSSEVPFIDEINHMWIDTIEVNLKDLM